VLFPWKKQSKQKEKFAERLRSQSAAEASVIRLTNVDLAPSIQELNCNISQGSWMLLAGPEDFGKALFCDLCFSFILPESGEVNPKMLRSDVGFLGRSNTTYGSALIDHLYSGVKERSKELVVYIIENVFGKNLKKQLSSNNPLEFSDNKSISEIELQERDFMEIAEANLLLQNRPAAIIDTTSDFYRIALEQGFQHSKLLLESGKTLFWIIDDTFSYSNAQSPWKAYPEIKKTSLYFMNEGSVNHIN